MNVLHFGWLAVGVLCSANNMKILQYCGFIPIVGATGGAERVFCNMANALTVRRHEVYAVCNDACSGQPAFPLDDRVRFINLNSSVSRKFTPSRRRMGRWLRCIAKETWDRYIVFPLLEKKGEPLVQLIREVQPDAVILYFANDYLSMSRQPVLDVPVILMLHENAETFAGYTDSSGRAAKINKCPHLQVMQRSFIPKIQKIYRGSIHVIPNTVPQIEEKDLAVLTAEKTQRTITMVSRIEKAKQQHLLIQAFEQLAKDYTEWKVEIYGSLSDHGYPRKLKEMITSLGLIGRVELMGTTDCPLDVLRNADICAFPSSAEGFGLALAEAMAVGLPCVGLKTTSSVNELIVDGVNGFLADSTPEDFAAKLKILMDDQNLRAKMGKAGHEMMKQYAPEKVWDQWENLITEVVQQHRQHRAV